MIRDDIPIAAIPVFFEYQDGTPGAIVYQDFHDDLGVVRLSKERKRLSLWVGGECVWRSPE